MNYIDQAMSLSDSFALNAATLGNVPGFVIRPLLKHRKNLLLAARECRKAGCEEEVRDYSAEARACRGAITRAIRRYRMGLISAK